MEKYKFLKGKETNDVCVVYFSIIFQEVFKKHVFGSKGVPGGSDNKESACNAGDPGSIPGMGRSLEKGMAILSSIREWRIPWIEKPGRL